MRPFSQDVTPMCFIFFAMVDFEVCNLSDFVDRVDMAVEAANLSDNTDLSVNADLGDDEDLGNNAAIENMSAVDVVNLGDSVFAFLFLYLLCGVEYLCAHFGGKNTGSFPITHI